MNQKIRFYKNAGAKMGLKVYVGNLPQSATVESVRDFMSQFGEVADVRLMIDVKTQSLRGFGFVTFKAESAFQSALGANDILFEGRPIKIAEARKNL